jgi:hypothetical protein
MLFLVIKLAEMLKKELIKNKIMITKLKFLLLIFKIKLITMLKIKFEDETLKEILKFLKKIPNKISTG